MLTIVQADSPVRLIAASLSSAMSQASGSTVPSWSVIACMSLVFLTFTLVVLPAVWGRNAELREAAYRVLDRLLRAFLGR
jgi:hypothetical protein